MIDANKPAFSLVLEIRPGMTSLKKVDVCLGPVRGRLLIRSADAAEAVTS